MWHFWEKWGLKFTAWQKVASQHNWRQSPQRWQNSMSWSTIWEAFDLVHPPWKSQVNTSLLETAELSRERTPEAATHSHQSPWDLHSREGRQVSFPLCGFSTLLCLDVPHTPSYLSMLRILGKKPSPLNRHLLSIFCVPSAVLTHISLRPQLRAWVTSWDHEGLLTILSITTASYISKMCQAVS